MNTHHDSDRDVDVAHEYVDLIPGEDGLLGVDGEGVFLGVGVAPNVGVVPDELVHIVHVSHSFACLG